MPEQNLQFDPRHSNTVIYTGAVGKYRFIGWGGAHSVSAADIQGISELAGPAGAAGSVVTEYSYPVEAAAAIPAGADVAPSTDGTGRAVVATGMQCGRALTAAKAAGELVVVRIRLVQAGLGSSALAASQALVSGDVNSATGTALQLLQALPLTTTWAQRAAAIASGRTAALFSDVGIGGANAFYRNGRWRWEAGNLIVGSTIASATQNSSTRAVMGYATLLPGMLGDGDFLRLELDKTLSGTDTDTTETAWQTQANGLPTVWGPANMLLTTASLSNATPHITTVWEWKRINATTLRPVSISTNSGFGANNSLADITVPDMDVNTSYLQLSGKLTTGAGAVSTLNKMLVILRQGS